MLSHNTGTGGENVRTPQPERLNSIQEEEFRQNWHLQIRLLCTKKIKNNFTDSYYLICTGSEKNTKLNAIRLMDFNFLLINESFKLIFPCWFFLILIKPTFQGLPEKFSILTVFNVQFSDIKQSQSYTTITNTHLHNSLFCKNETLNPLMEWIPGMRTVQPTGYRCPGLWNHSVWPCQSNHRLNF